eukprot:14775971-Alexandrium_andersonii.AAC.1
MNRQANEKFGLNTEHNVDLKLGEHKHVEKEMGLSTNMGVGVSAEYGMNTKFGKGTPEARSTRCS